MTGKQFGKLIVIAPATDYISPSGYHLSRWKCKCDCGNLTIVVGGELTSGSTRSCGCLKNTAGLLKDNQHLISQYDLSNGDWERFFENVCCNYKKYVKQGDI